MRFPTGSHCVVPALCVAPSISVAPLCVALACLVAVPMMGCRKSEEPDSATRFEADSGSIAPAERELKEALSPDSTASPEDVESAKQRISSLGGAARAVMSSGMLTEIVIPDGSQLNEQDIELFGRLTDLIKLQIFNCRFLNDDLASRLSGLKQLTSLALTNTVINDPTVEMIAQAFPGLTELDLSSNTNVTRGAMKFIAELGQLRSLTLIQNGFNDLSFRRLRSLQELRSLDLRGNMEAGNMTLGVVGELPNLTAFKHRSTAVTDEGMAELSKNSSLQNLLIQDFMITSDSGRYLAALKQLRQLEIFRCQGFGSEGVAALEGLELDRLTLRDLPSVDDSAMTVFQNLPKLRRLYLHELDGITDEGFENLQHLDSLELLDVWSVPQITDASVEVLARLPNLKELTLRTTGISDASIDVLLSMTGLQSLVIKENSDVTATALQRLKTRQWRKLDIES
jgi:Leucine-rich repeat (LRR) protein